MADNASISAYWPVTIFAVFWNVLGVWAFIHMLTVSPEALSAQFGTEYAQIIANQPIWAKAAFGIAALSGLVGSVGLVMHKAWSQYCFVISLACLIIYDLWMLIAGIFEYISVFDLLFSMAVLLIAIGFVWFAASEKTSGNLK